MHAFPKSVRLRRNQEIRCTLDQGLKVVGPLMVVFLKPRVAALPEDLVGGGSRLGVVASRKVGNAVVRNRVKRQLREAYRHLRPELLTLAALKDGDVVVVARAAAATASTASMAEALQHGLRRLKRQIDCR